MKRATSKITLSKKGFLAQSISRHHQIEMDRPEEDGGNNDFATPVEYLLSALGGCVSMTLRVFANQKGWNLGEITVVVSQKHKLTSEGLTTWLEEDISFQNDITNIQREELIIAAKKCPVAQLLKNNTKINSNII